MYYWSDAQSTWIKTSFIRVCSDNGNIVRLQAQNSAAARHVYTKVGAPGTPRPTAEWKRKGSAAGARGRCDTCCPPASSTPRARGIHSSRRRGRRRFSASAPSARPGKARRFLHQAAASAQRRQGSSDCRRTFAVGTRRSPRLDARTLARRQARGNQVTLDGCKASTPPLLATAGVTSSSQ